MSPSKGKLRNQPSAASLPRCLAIAELELWRCVSVSVKTFGVRLSFLVLSNPTSLHHRQKVLGNKASWRTSPGGPAREWPIYEPVRSSHRPVAPSKVDGPPTLLPTPRALYTALLLLLLLLPLRHGDLAPTKPRPHLPAHGDALVQLNQAKQRSGPQAHDGLLLLSLQHKTAPSPP